jgi:hypothetical protein
LGTGSSFCSRAIERLSRSLRLDTPTGTDLLRVMTSKSLNFVGRITLAVRCCDGHGARSSRAKGKPVDFKQLLRMEPDSGTTNIRNVSSSHWKRWLPPDKPLPGAVHIAFGIRRDRRQEETGVVRSGRDTTTAVFCRPQAELRGRPRGLLGLPRRADRISTKDRSDQWSGVTFAFSYRLCARAPWPPQRVRFAWITRKPSDCSTILTSEGKMVLSGSVHTWCIRAGMSISSAHHRVPSGCEPAIRFVRTTF